MIRRGFFSSAYEAVGLSHFSGLFVPRSFLARVYLLAPPNSWSLRRGFLNLTFRNGAHSVSPFGGENEQETICVSRGQNIRYLGDDRRRSHCWRRATIYGANKHRYYVGTVPNGAGLGCLTLLGLDTDARCMFARSR